MFNCPNCGCDIPSMDMWDGVNYTFICFDCGTKTVIDHHPEDEEE